MASIIKKIDGTIKSYTYNYHYSVLLHDNGTYVLGSMNRWGQYTAPIMSEEENALLKPDGDSNDPRTFRHTCDSTVAELVKQGKTAIHSDKTDIPKRYTLLGPQRLEITASTKNDIVYLGHEYDRAYALGGDNFFELDNRNISAASREGIDVFMIRCGNAHAKGRENGDHYFINISQKCKDKGHITIDEMPSHNDVNQLHLCNFKFGNTYGNTLEILEKNGIHVKFPDCTHNALELYFKNNIPSSNKPDVIINNFCNNDDRTATNPPIAIITDRSGNTISLKDLVCPMDADDPASSHCASNSIFTDIAHGIWDLIF